MVDIVNEMVNMNHLIQAGSYCGSCPQGKILWAEASFIESPYPVYKLKKNIFGLTTIRYMVLRVDNNFTKTVD